MKKQPINMRKIRIGIKINAFDWNLTKIKKQLKPASKDHFTGQPFRVVHSAKSGKTEPFPHY